MIPVPKEPPQFKQAPPVRRWIRFNQNYAGTAITSNITPNGVVNVDATDYTGQTAVSRYTNVRIIQCKAWLALYDSGVTTVGMPTLSMYDVATGFNLIDYMAPGVDFASLGMECSLQSRQSWLPVTNTTTAVFTVGVSNAMGQSGQVNIDVLCEFN